MLSEPLTLEPTIKLVPYSGVQFVEYAFNIDKAGRLSRRFIERELDPSLWSEGKRTLCSRVCQPTRLWRRSLQENKGC